MAKRGKQQLGCSGIIGLCILLVVGGIVTLWQKNRLAAIAAGIPAILLLIAVGYLLRPKRCDICGNIIQRASYKWTVQGEKKRLCPHCNQALARKKSSAAIKSRF